MSSSIATGTSSGSTGGALQRRGGHVELAHRLQVLLGAGLLEVAEDHEPIRWAIRKKPQRVQLSATSFTTTREPGTRQAAATNAAEDGSPGTVTASSSSFVDLSDRDPRPLAFERHRARRRMRSA